MELRVLTLVMRLLVYAKLDDRQISGGTVL
jgi:hypothetical protein